jgi:hypothetical protein
MFHQDNVQTARVHPPALYSAYERKDHESWGEQNSVRVWTYKYMFLVTHPVGTRKGEYTVWRVGNRSNCGSTL